MYLAASVVALLIGPLLYQLAHRGTRVLGFLEGFAFITIAGLLLFSILPQAIGGGGPVTWAFAAVGLAFPVALERWFHHLARQAHFLILLVGMAGLAVHAAIDGVALALPDAGIQALGHTGTGHGDEDLALAVILHRFPVGLAVWYLLVPSLGIRIAAGVLLAMGVATAVGYTAADAAPAMTGPLIGWFQAFVAGSILHVIIYEPGHHNHHGDTRAARLDKWPDRMGLICGLALLFLYL